MSNKIRAYISHPIRGKQQGDATDEQIQANIKRAINFGTLLSDVFPTIDFYVPGEHDEFVLIAYKEGYITEQQVLDVDCVIIHKCNFLLVFAPDKYTSKGMKVEIDYAVQHNIPIIAIVDGDYDEVKVSAGIADEYTTKIIHAINCHLITMLR